MHGIELTIVLIATLTLAVGSALRLVANRTRFPYTILVMLTGIASGLGLSHLPASLSENAVLRELGKGADISSQLIIFVFLPALVFESAFSIEVHDFRKRAGAVIVYAAPALVLSALLTGALMVGLTRVELLGGWSWGWPVALLFGALISATDPVAVVAILRELGVSKRLAVLIEGESLLNDGTSIVVFSVLLGVVAQGAELHAGPALASFAWVVLGGAAVGALLALVITRWLGALFNDPLSEITLTLVLAYAAMIVAEGVLHVSGVMAVVVAGLWMSGAGKTKVSPEVSHFLHRFWQMLGHIANTLIFFLVGLVIAGQLDRVQGGDVLLIAVSYVGVMVVRTALTFAAQPITHRLSDGVSAKDSLVISWGGLRGAVSLALALVVARHPGVEPELGRQVLVVTAGVVLLTILVNGTTMARVLALVGYDQPPLGEQIARLTARGLVLDRVKGHLDQLSQSRDLRTVVWDLVVERLEQRRREVAVDIEALRSELQRAEEAERVASYWRRVMGIEKQAYWEAFAHGTLSEGAVQLLFKEVERHADALARGELTPPETRSPDLRGSILGKLRRLLGREAAGFETFCLIYDLSRAESLAAEKVLRSLDTLQDVEPRTVAEIHATYQRFLRLGKERLEDIRTHLPEMASAIETRLAERIGLNREREEFEHLAHRGALDEAACEAELSSVDARMHRLQRSARRVRIPETAELVASTPLFSSLDEAALEELARLTEEVVVPAGRALFVEGDAGDSLFVIARGAVHVVRDDGGREVLLDVLGGGDILGEMALLTGAPRTATARAATSVTLGRIRRSDFDHLMETQPALRAEVWRAFARRTFDNHVTGLAGLARLDHGERVGWFDTGRLESVPAGGALEPAEELPWLFVLTGSVRLEGIDGAQRPRARVHHPSGAIDAAPDAVHPAPRLLDVRARHGIVAASEARVVRLPDPSAGASPSPDAPG